MTGAAPRPPAVRALLAALGGAALIASGAGCGEDCCRVDSLPIPLTRAAVEGGAGAPQGALVALGRSPAVMGGAPFPIVVDTASPMVVFNAAAPTGQVVTHARSFDLLDPTGSGTAVRARFRAVTTLDLPVAPIGGGLQPAAVLGGNLLRAFSVEFRFGAPCAPGAMPTGSADCATVTFWRHQGADLSFLEDAGFAVLRFPLRGGGEVTAVGDKDIFGSRAPLELPPTRVVLRGCAAPKPFTPDTPEPEACCKRGDEVTNATGVDLGLLVATGLSPLVLSQSAWNRVAAQLDVTPVMVAGPLRPPTWPAAVAAQWTTIPRLALVDLEATPANDPGPCVELGRARRLEWVSYQRVHFPEKNACAQVCDTDPRESDKAQNSAAYLEVGGEIPVAVVDDTEPFLQALRFDIRPEGPEIDGLVGAAALGGARMELDYPSTPARAIFSCEKDAPRAACFAAARCPRLPDRDHRHLCFGLGTHDLSPTCAPTAACLAPVP